MAKAEFNGYGGKVEHFEHEMGAGQKFNDVSGGAGHVDAFGDEEKKEKDAIDMNAGEAFNKKDLAKIDVMGTDCPKKSGKPGQFDSNKGDHFKTDTENGSIDPFGTDAGKSKSWQNTSRK